MPADVDDMELYPPDAELPTGDERHRRNRAAIGAAFLVWGAALLVERALGVNLETFGLGIGIGALVGWSQVRRYGWFVVGAVATAAGIGTLLEGAFHGFGSGMSLLATAAGFGAVYVRYPRRSMWAAVIAVILAVMGVGSFGLALIGLLPAMLGRFLLPLLVIAGGGLLLMRNSLPPKTVKVGLAALVAAFVLLGGASVPDNPDPPRLDAGPSGEASFSSRGELTGLSGGTLVFRADRANVILRTTPGVDGSVMAVGSAVGRRLRPPGGPPAAVADIEVETSGRTMTVAPATDGDDVTYTFTLPEDVEVDIEVMSGTIEGRLAGAHGVLRTADGDISIDLADGAEEGTAGDGPYLFDTDSGQIRIDSTLAVTLDLRADSGDVKVDGKSTEARYRSPAGTIGAVVVARSESSDIHVDAPPARQGP